MNFAVWISLLFLFFFLKLGYISGCCEIKYEKEDYILFEGSTNVEKPLYTIILLHGLINSEKAVRSITERVSVKLRALLKDYDKDLLDKINVITPVPPIRKFRYFFGLSSVQRSYVDLGIGFVFGYIRRKQYLSAIYNLRNWILKQAKSGKLELHRTFIYGYCVGGSLALATTLALGHKIAGTASNSASIYHQQSLKRNKLVTIEGLKTPFLMLHSRVDRLVSILFAYRTRRFLKSLGAKVSFLDLPRGSHQAIMVNNLKNALEWIIGLIYVYESGEME